MITIEHHPSSRQLAIFGFVWLVFFSIWGAMAWWKTGSTAAAIACWIAAGAVPALGLVIPGLLRIVYVGMAYATFPIGFVVSHLILAVLYYVVLTPMGLTMRLFGYNPMCRRYEREEQTYWVSRKEPESVSRYFRQS